MQNIESDRPDKVFNKVYLEIKSGERLPITIGSIVSDDGDIGHVIELLSSKCVVGFGCGEDYHIKEYPVTYCYEKEDTIGDGEAYIIANDGKCEGKTSSLVSIGGVQYHIGDIVLIRLIDSDHGAPDFAVKVITKSIKYARVFDIVMVIKEAKDVKDGYVIDGCQYLKV